MKLRDCHGIKKKHSKIRVAVIEPVGGHGGMDYYDIGLCKGIKKAGLDVTLFTCDETHLPDRLEVTVERVYERIYGGDSAVLRALRYICGSFRAVLRSWRESRIVCHFHWFHVGPLEIFNIGIAKVLGRKVVVTAHDVKALAKGLSVPLFVRFAYHYCDAVIAHNEVSRAELVCKIGVSQEKIRVIPHGNYLHVINNSIDRVQARQHLKVPERAKILLFFGQIKEVKGLDVLFQALRSLKKEMPDVLLLIAGKVWKTDFTKYDSLIEKYGIRKHIRANIMHIPNSEVANYYAAADMVVLPYRKIYQSGVLLMAMSYCRTVVVSDLPGMIEVITDNKTGLVFRSGDADHLAAKILSAFKNPELIDKLSKNGENLIREKYDWGKIGESVAALYRTCAG